MQIKTTLCDARGNQSKTLFFVTATWLVLLVKFILSGVTFSNGLAFAPMDVMNFGVAVTGVLAIWTAREKFDKQAHNDA